MIEIIILVEKHSPRLDYVISFLEDKLGITVELSLEQSIESKHSPVIDYRSTPKANNLSIYNSGLLYELEVTNFSKPDVRKSRYIELFPSNDTGYGIAFDLFGAIFYCLSRYEEYQDFTGDQHDRFSATESHAHINSYLERPVVDEWVQLMRELIEDDWQIKLPKPKPFQILPTIDVDVAWAYLHRKPIHPIGSQLKKLVKGQEDLLEEQRQAYKTGKDPFDTFDLLKEKIQEFNNHYFFLCNFALPFDTTYFLDRGEFKKLIKEQDTFATVGVHPSYESYGVQIKIQQEKEWLEKTIGRSIKTSRQHYLKLSMPYTYRDLIASDISSDFSMGYADRCGFRAGTSIPFYFYDLLKEESTDLLIHPFSVMDVTLKDYQKYNIEQAIETINKIKETLKTVNGQFSFIWHNSSFAKLGGWGGWDRVFDALIAT
jgi:hypothetical protein